LPDQLICGAALAAALSKGMAVAALFDLKDESVLPLQRSRAAPMNCAGISRAIFSSMPTTSGWSR